MKYLLVLLSFCISGHQVQAESEFYPSSETANTDMSAKQWVVIQVIMCPPYRFETEKCLLVQGRAGFVIVELNPNYI